MIPSALGTEFSGTRRITVAVASDQKPPITMPRRDLATINTAKFGAMAMMTSDKQHHCGQSHQKVTAIESRRNRGYDKAGDNCKQAGNRNSLAGHAFRGTQIVCDRCE